MIGLNLKLRATFLANPSEERIQRVLLARIFALNLRARLTAGGNHPPYSNSGYLCDMFLSFFDFLSGQEMVQKSRSLSTS